jgi:hypothetical protein
MTPVALSETRRAKIRAEKGKARLMFYGRGKDQG